MPEDERTGGLESTGRLTSEQLAQLIAEERGQQPKSQTALMLYHRDGIEVVRLDEGDMLVIGRQAPADIRVGDGSLSRQHASVELRDGMVTVEDLQSTNGTWVDGKKVERVTLGQGAQLAFGAVTARVQRVGPSEAHLFGLESHDAFESRIEAEVVRALTFSRDLALLMFRASNPMATPVASWIPALQKVLRPVDHSALYSRDTLEVLLPEACRYDAQRFVQTLAPNVLGLTCGIGAFPECASSAGELITVTREALQRTGDAYPIGLAPIKTEAGSRQVDRNGKPLAESKAMKALLAEAKKVAGTKIPVLLLGQTGTGKEVMARTIHEKSKRRKEPIISINCGCIPTQLVESTLFGHEKGAFTGADKQRQGVFEAADGGTVFLDEVGELPLPAQAALLRVLETQRFCRVGSTDEIEVDVRLLAATHRDLEQMCQEGTFRQDLFYRLNVMQLAIPPLRERKTEIEALAKRFMSQANKANDCAVRKIDDAAMRLLLDYTWPGNVRELKNAIERAVVLAQEGSISVEDLPQIIRNTRSDGVRNDAAAAVDPAWPEDEVINLRAETKAFESKLILRALEASDYKRADAAKRLGLPLRTLSRKMMEHGLGEKS
jgi:DNA-binding NtrC family response regulator